MSFNQGPFSNVVSYYRMLARRTGKAGRDFATMWSRIAPVLIVGRDYSDTNRAYQAASGEIQFLAGPANPPEQYGSLVMFNPRDVEVQCIAVRAYNVSTPGFSSRFYASQPSLGIGNLSNLFDPFSDTAGVLFEPQLRNALTPDGANIIPGSTTFRLGIATGPPPGSAIGIRLSGNRSGNQSPYQSGAFESFGSSETMRCYFDPPMYVPRGAGLVVSETWLDDNPDTAGLAAVADHTFECSIEFREVGP